MDSHRRFRAAAASLKPTAALTTTAGLLELVNPIEYAVAAVNRGLTADYSASGSAWAARAGLTKNKRDFTSQEFRGDLSV